MDGGGFAVPPFYLTGVLGSQMEEKWEYNVDYLWFLYRIHGEGNIRKEETFIRAAHLSNLSYLLNK